MCTAVVVCGYNKHTLARIFKPFKQFYKALVACPFAVEAQVTRNKHGVSFVRLFKPLKNRVVYAFGFGKAFLLVTHKLVVLLTVTAKRIFIKMCVGNQIKAEGLHCKHLV